MRFVRFAVAALFLLLIATSWSGAHGGLFRRCHSCQTHSGQSGRTPGNVDSRTPENIQSPPTTPLKLNIASSGLENEVKARIADWASKGVTPGTLPGQSGTKSIKITIEIDGQKFEGTLTLKGTGKDPVVVPPGDLPKALQAAFDTDTVQGKAEKGKIKDNLFAAFKKLAESVGGDGELNLTSDTLEGVRLLKNAVMLNAAGPKNLPKTQAVINEHLNKFLPKGDTTALTPPLRTTLSSEFERIAQALDAVKLKP